MKSAVLCAALLAALAAAQDTATVEGVVVNKVTGAGIGGASVRFATVNAGRYDASTDETGAFRVTGIKPGDYGFSVQKEGYFNPEPLMLRGRQTHHLSAGDPVRLRFELDPPAILRGRVLGADGNPARAEVDLGRGTTVNTGADGSFVFQNLAPGTYTLLARPKKAEPVSIPQGTRAEVVPTYYPSVVERAQAQSVAARAGVDLGGYEIRLQSVPVYRVRGVVLEPDGKPAAKAVVELQAKIAGGTADRGFFLDFRGTRQSFSVRNGPVELPPAEDEPFVTKEDGAFEFPAVRAGEWSIRAEGDPIWDQRQDSSSIGRATFTLGRGDPDDLKIQLARPFKPSGTVVLSDGSAPSSGVSLGVALYSEGGYSGSGGTTLDKGGVLQFGNLVPGIYQIGVNVLGGNYYAASIWLGPAEVTAQSVDLTPASPPIKIVLKPAGTVRGTIVDADTGAIVLFPQSFAGVGYSMESGAGKTFEMTGIPPGDYYAIALDRFDPLTMAEVVILRGLMPRATSVRVEQGAAASLQLKVNRGPE